jgi:hypothetical protein
MMEPAHRWPERSFPQNTYPTIRQMPDTTSTVSSLMLRELDTFKRQIAAFPDDRGPWMAGAGIANTAGTLALHCAGNIQHFIGAKLCGTGYVRQRELEFSRRDVARAEIISELDRAIAAVELLGKKKDTDVPAVFPEVFGGKQVNTDVMLVHLAVHLGYHLGQADYHRRLTTGDSTALDGVSAKGLPGVT